MDKSDFCIVTDMVSSFKYWQFQAMGCIRYQSTWHPGPPMCGNWVNCLLFMGSHIERNDYKGIKRQDITRTNLLLQFLKFYFEKMCYKYLHSEIWIYTKVTTRVLQRLTKTHINPQNPPLIKQTSYIHTVLILLDQKPPKQSPTFRLCVRKERNRKF